MYVHAFSYSHFIHHFLYSLYSFSVPVSVSASWKLAFFGPVPHLLANYRQSHILKRRAGLSITCLAFSSLNPNISNAWYHKQPIHGIQAELARPCVGWSGFKGEQSPDLIGDDLNILASAVSVLDRTLHLDILCNVQVQRQKYSSIQSPTLQVERKRLDHLTLEKAKCLAPRGFLKRCLSRTDEVSD